MKKILKSLCAGMALAAAMSLVSAQEVVTIYAPDGRIAQIYESDLEAYKAVGWYDNFEDTVQTVYAPDGRSETHFKAEIPAYLAVGWFENRDDTLAVIFDGKGNSALIYLAELEAYRAAGWFGHPLRVDPARPMVSLTFDDGPSLSATPVILDVLEKYRVRATFFQLGSEVAKYPLVTKRACEMGCEIGTHTYSHPNLAKLSSWDIASQIRTSSAEISLACGSAPGLLRPPYGSYNDTVKAAASMPLILWSVDTLDWKTRDTQKDIYAVLSSTKDGDIVLMHDIYMPTAEAVKTIVPELLKRGFQLVTVSELAAAKGYSMSAATAYSSFR